MIHLMRRYMPVLDWGRTYDREALSNDLIAAVIVAGGAATIAIAATTVYHAVGGRRVVDRAGAVRVRCPDCGYSMVGLESTTCPECGVRYTVDELIRAQGYQMDEPDESPKNTEQIPAAEPALE